jgi:hypothetical protein
MVCRPPLYEPLLLEEAAASFERFAAEAMPRFE